MSLMGRDRSEQKGDVKSLLVSNLYFPPQRGGISHFMGSIAKALGPQRVCCLTSVSADGSGGEVEAEGVRIYRRSLAFSPVTAIQAAGLGLAYAEIMARERPRVVQLAMAYEGTVGLWGHRMLGLPFVIYAHGNEILDAGQAQWKKPLLALRQAARVFANSRFTGELVKQVGVDPSRVAIVRPGCDVEEFRPQEPERAFRERLLGAHSNSRVLLTVGLESLKGHDMVIRALPSLLKSFPDVTYLVVGGGSQERLDVLARECGVRDHVIFTGRVAQSDLPAVYGLCEIFVMPSRQDLAAHSVEGFGLVYLEASASGKPVVGGRSGGVPDAVVEGTTGLLVDPLDPKDIAAALTRLLTNRDYARQLGEQGRVRTVGEFRWESVGRQVQGLLNEVDLENKRLRPGVSSGLEMEG